GRLYAAGTSGKVYRIVGAAAAACGPPKAKAFIGIRAQGRKVKRGRRALITAFVSPCNGRRGEPVKLLRGGHPVGTRHLNRACSVRFRPRIRHRVSFRASIAEDGTYLMATSRRLKLRIDHRKKPVRKARPGGS
ncbi:MAG TPA: hypothetical protein VHM66_11445, partial [Solirubrobacterales bacterium]|nr:hypothetical protein [Solirubrobacterales bacterium]